MPQARRFQRVNQSVKNPDAIAYSEINYGGTALPLKIGSNIPTLAATFDNHIKSIKFNRPAKLYMYENALYDGCILYLPGTANIADVSQYYYESSKPFSNALSSIQVRAANYTTPAASLAPVSLTDGYTIPVHPQSSLYGNCIIESVNFDIVDMPTYNKFMALFGPIGTPAQKTATENKIKDCLNQIICNVCAVLYRNSDQQPVRYPIQTLHFVVDTANYAQADAASGNLTITSLGSDQTPTFMATILAHELTHVYQNPKYTAANTAILLGTLEGIATYVSMQFGYAPARPAGGGTSWYAGYETTAHFFDYIARLSPAPEPDFIHTIVMSMNGADPSIGNAPWSEGVITLLNARHMTVDQLWAEYTAWVGP